jgi:hypothetical protein
MQMAKYITKLRRGIKDDATERNDWEALITDKTIPEKFRIPQDGELVLEYDNGVPRLKIGDGKRKFSELPYMSIDSFILPKQEFVNLLANWDTDDNGRLYQEVSVEGVSITPNSKIDLQPTPAQLDIFREKDLTFVAENYDCVVRVYCIGQEPQNEYEKIPVTVTEVVATDKPIIGNTTATPYPRPDWNQTDEAKADYIKNKPNVLLVKQNGSIEVGDKTTALGSGAVATGHSSNSAADMLTEEELSDFSKIIEKWDYAHLRRVDSSHPEYTDDSTEAGLFALAFGDNTHTEGEDCIADLAGHAEGRRTKATGKRAHSEGTDTAATNSNTHAEGQDTIASGNVAHAEGYGTEAEGAHSHTEGVRTKTTKVAQTSHTEGFETEARAAYTHTEGLGTVAASEVQHVQGRLNIIDDNGEFAHIIGNGKAVYDDKGRLIEDQCIRDNIHTVDWDGNAWYAGDVKAGTISLKLTNSLASSAKTIAESKPGNTQITEYRKSDGTTATRTGIVLNTSSGNDASGNLSITGGYRCKALKDHDMSLGTNNSASGSLSTTIGHGLITETWKQMVLGNFNALDSNASFIVAIGTNDDDRKNAFTINKITGDAWFVRNINATGTITAKDFTTTDGTSIVSQIGDIDSVLDSILTIQNSLIGGDV